jgi:ATP-dependent DNA helicase UvrD/PcrA
MSLDEAPYADAPAEIVAALGGRLPTGQQWAAISHPVKDPAAVIAGAGSGKTAVIAARVVWLTLERLAGRDGALPSEILCLTFTNKAAEELARRVRDATSHLGLPEAEEATVLTYHAFAARLLDDYGLRMGLEAGPMLLSTAHRWQIASAVVGDASFEHLEVRTVADPVRKMLDLADHCSNHLIDPVDLEHQSLAFAEIAEIKKASDKDARDSALKRAELARCVAAYRERKARLHAIDYGDQITLACRLITEHPEVAEEFRGRYPVVLLDEFQDTNHAQAVLMKALFGPGSSIMCVGDPDQNIFAWRGASLRNILNFPRDFGGGTKPLDVNFRSGSRILKVANEIIDSVPAERRAADVGKLKPHPDRSEGRVRAFVATDERAEAVEIARLIKESGRRYSDVAVLCRKKRLFGPIADVLKGEGIPVEVIDLGGLLQLPDVVEIVAWLRVLEDPSRNIALARLLQGPRWRIGYRDTVALARWSARRNRTLRGDLGVDEHPGDVAFALAESLDHLDDEDMTGLSDEARSRLVEFRTLLGSLREVSSGPLDGLVEQVAERSGLLAELEVAASSEPGAAGARRNILNFAAAVGAFAPVEGEATLATLISWLDAAEDAEESELEQAQSSDENTVKLMTIHKAKGLEWPMVFVPGLAVGKRSSLFPDTGRQPNPVTQPNTMPFELRGDADVLPRYEGDIKRFKAALAERGMEEERRLAYVALTRAKDDLIVSAAFWYEGPADPFEPGPFYKQIAGHSSCDVLFAAECPEDSPLVEHRRARAGSWPPPSGPVADPLFPAGWHAAATSGDVSSLIESLPPGERASFEESLRADRERIALVRERAIADPRAALPRSLSVSAMLDYERCPKLFYWGHVRPLPRRPSAAARLGTEVHRWIERRDLDSRATLFEIDEPPDLDLSERAGGGGARDTLRKTFEGSRFARAKPLYTERPFLLWLDGFTVGGRVDAIFGPADGSWEIVDYKTGGVPEEADPVPGLQLDLYALAAMEIWGKEPEDLTLTFFYISEGREVTRPSGDVETIRKRALAALSSMSAGAFEATPGEQCRWCDFLAFCEPGARHQRGGSGRGLSIRDGDA